MTRPKHVNFREQPSLKLTCDGTGSSGGAEGARVRRSSPSSSPSSPLQLQHENKL